MELASTVHEAPGFAAVQELFHRRGWTDGLPVVPPTGEAVAACLEDAAMPPEHVLGVESVRGRAVTAEKVAINTVMAGGLPLHFPVIVTALTAMLREPFTMHGATASTGGCAVFIVVNGDERLRLGMDGTFNALGNSDRASAVVGRAIRLCLINLFDVRPGGIDRSTLGHPGKFSFCIAEDEEGSPWEPLAAARGVPDGGSAVTVMAAGAPRQIMNEWTTEPEEILETFAAEMRANMRQYSIWPGNYAVVMPPQLRDHFAAAGWSRAGRLRAPLRAGPHPPPRVGDGRQGPGGGRARRPRVPRAPRPRPPPAGRGRRAGRRVRGGHPALARGQEPGGDPCGRGLSGLRAARGPHERRRGRAGGLTARRGTPRDWSGPCRGTTAPPPPPAGEEREEQVEDDGMTLRVLDPTFEEGVAAFALAPRLAGLEGATVGIISNGKKGTAPFFARLATLLRDRYGAADVVLRVKRSFSAPAEAALMDEAAEWSAAIAGVGD